MLENLFDNAGTKIKNAAKISFIVEAIFSVIGGFYKIIAEILPQIARDDDALIDIFICLFYILCAVAGAYIVSLLIYGFGCLVENSDSKRKTATKILEKLSEKEVKEIKPVAREKESNVKEAKENKINTADEKAEQIKEETPEVTEATEEDSILKASLKYALKYSTTQGMRSHLTYRTMAVAIGEEKELIKNILANSDSDLISAINEAIESL